MSKFTYSVSVIAENKEQADQVMAERFGYEEDYGFDYQVEIEAYESNSQFVGKCIPCKSKCEDCNKRTEVVYKCWESFRHSQAGFGEIVNSESFTKNWVSLSVVYKYKCYECAFGEIEDE